MKILIINRNHFVGGGADRVYLNTGNILVTNGHDVAYFSTVNDNNLDSNEKEYFVSNIKTRNSSFYSKIKGVKKYLYNNEASDNLAKLIKDFKPDVAHIHLFYGVLSSSILKTLNDFNIPIVTTIHDYRLLCPANAMLDKSGQICEKCKNDKFYNCILKRCSEGNVFQSSVIASEAYLRKFVFDPLILVNHFIFVSEFSKNKHISFDKRYTKKSSHLYNFGTSSGSESKVIKGKYIFYYGRLSKEKGILNLINAAKKTNSKLKIAGAGPQKEEVLKVIEGFSNIEYVGFQSGVDLNNLIKKSSFVVVPSEWYENNPMTIVESFSIGKPVIGSNIGGIPELVNKKTGYIFESGNLESLINSIELSEKLTEEQYDSISHNCFDFAKKHFSKEIHFMELLNIYQKVINENKQFNQ
jgi:glycosyltransferase involved in cell wall biosynthesis